MEPIEVVLALWKSRLLSERQVQVWVDEQIRAVDVPAGDLLALAVGGPKRCLNSAEFCARAATLGYVLEFSVRVALIDADSSQDLRAFVVWASRACMGQDHQFAEVVVGYQLDDAIGERNDLERAVQVLLEELPSVAAACKERARQVLSLVPELFPTFQNVAARVPN